jgi:hypothetical protein
MRLLVHPYSSRIVRVSDCEQRKDKALVINDLKDKIVVQTDKDDCLTFPIGNDQAIKQIVRAVNWNWAKISSKNIPYV